MPVFTGCALLVTGLRRAVLGAKAVAQGIHQVDDVGGPLRSFRPFDRMPGGLALDELAKGEFVLVLELSRIEVAGFAVEDITGKLDHVF